MKNFSKWHKSRIVLAYITWTCQQLHRSWLIKKKESKLYKSYNVFTLTRMNGKNEYWCICGWKSRLLRKISRYSQWSGLRYTFPSLNFLVGTYLKLKFKKKTSKPPYNTEKFSKSGRPPYKTEHFQQRSRLPCKTEN